LKNEKKLDPSPPSKGQWCTKLLVSISHVKTYCNNFTIESTEKHSHYAF